MGALKGLRIASLNEVIIRKENETARIIYKDRPFEGGMNLTIGPQLEHMSDAEILQCFNEAILSMQISVAEFEPLEIEPGYPQIKFDRQAKAWYAQGQILRCELEDGDDGQLAILIDDKKLSGDEFIRMISSYRGWAMRIQFMDESQLTDPPEPKIVKRPPKVKLD